MLESGSFLGGLQNASAQVKSFGQSMQNALSRAAGAGLDKFKGSMQAAASKAQALGGMALALGGGFSVAQGIKEAIEAQSTYRNLANQINRLSDSGKNWRDVMLMIETAADSAAVDDQQLAAAFRDVYSATGDLKYSEEAIKAIAVASRATGESMAGLAQPMQLAMRKFGVSADDAQEAMARIIEKVGVGGASLEAMNMRFASMAGEASEAGMKGKEGMSALLGVLLTLDSRVGEKASWGLKTIFQYLKDNTTYAKQFQKTARIKFEADTSALEKLRKIVGSESGRKTAELVFTSDSRVVYDQLVKPFEDAYKAAKDAGKSTKEATQAGYDAYDEAMAAMTKSTAKFATLQEQSADRLKNDPAAILEKALDELRDTFKNPEMMSAITSLAKQLPPVLRGLQRLIEWTSKNPWEGATALVTGLIVKDFAVAGIGMAVKSALLALFPAPGVGAAAGGAAAKGTAAGAAAGAGAAAKGGAVGAARAAAGVTLGAAGFVVGAALMTSGDEGSIEERRARTKATEKRAATGAKDRYAESYRKAREVVEKARTEQRVPAIERVTGPQAFPLPITTSRRAAGAERQVESAMVRAQAQAIGDDADKRRSSAKAAEELARSAGRASRELDRLRAPAGQGGGSNGLPPPGPTTPGYSPR